MHTVKSIQNNQNEFQSSDLSSRMNRTTITPLSELSPHANQKDHRKSKKI